MEISANELGNILNTSNRAVRMKAQKQSWSAGSETKKGGRQKKYIAGLLPEDIRSAAAKKEIESAGLSISPVITETQDCNVPERAKKTGLAKFQLVKAFQFAKESAVWGKKQRAARDFILAYNSGVYLPLVFQQIGKITKKTLGNLERKLVANGGSYLALCDGRGGWKKHGTTKWKARNLTEETKRVFLQCYLQPSQPSVIMAIRATRIIMEKKNIIENSADSTFRRWLTDYTEINSHVICLAREGMKAYQDQYAPYITRDASALSPGQCLVADGKVLNFLILHPETGKPVRMILIVFFDWASRCPVGWQLMPTENTMAIHAAFRRSAINLGRYPEAVYIDNGRAFKSKFFITTNPDMNEFAGLYGRVGTAVQTAKPYSGRSKVVERFFLTFQEQCECLLPSFCGDSIATKPAWMHRNEKFHKAWHKAKTDNWVPSIDEAGHIIESYFRWYVNQPHAGLNGSKPIDVLQPGLGPGIDANTLNYDFLWRKEIAPRKCRVRLYGIDYEADFLHGRSANAKLLIMYDASDLRKIYCYSKDKQYLGEALPVRALHPLASLFGDQIAMDAVTKTIKHHASLAKKTKEQLLELGASSSDIQTLDALPYNKVVPINRAQNTHIKTQNQPEKMDKTEIKRLELIMEQAEKDKAQEQKIKRPAIWQSDLQHYEWAFAVEYEHRQDLNEEDAAFMAYFEKTEEFKENYYNRFADLKELYSLMDRQKQVKGG